MDSNKQRGIRFADPEQPSTVEDDPEDDVPVSNQTNENQQFVAPPDYGEAGQTRSIPNELAVEPVSGYPVKAKAESAKIETEERTIPLDAYYAELAHPEYVRQLHRVSTVLHQTEATEALEIIFPPDDRVQIKNTKDYPWRCVCALNITANDGSRWIGTGWFAGPRTIITAGHCVYMNSRGGWVNEIEVIPGGNGEQTPYGSCNSASFRSVKGWTQKQKRSHDYGAIILPGNASLGQLVGSFGYICLNDLDLQGLMVNLSGYPGDKPWPTQWFHARPIDSVTPRTLVYQIDTLGGQSGSAVYRLKDGQRHVVGIHTNGDALGNSATRIVESVFNNIQQWIREVTE